MSGLPTARRRSSDAWRARGAWSRAAAPSGALTPPWPRSASASAARVTVTKHSAPPCHNKSPGAPAAGDPYPLLAAAATLRGRVRSAAGCALGGTRAPPHFRARPHARSRAAPGADSPPHPPRALSHLRPTPRVSLSVPRVQSAPTGRHAPRFREEPKGTPGALDWGQRCSGVAGGTRGRSGRAETSGGHAEAVPALPAGAGRREQGVGLGGPRSWVRRSGAPPAEPRPADPPTPTGSS